MNLSIEHYMECSIYISFFNLSLILLFEYNLANYINKDFLYCSNLTRYLFSIKKLIEDSTSLIYLLFVLFIK